MQIDQIIDLMRAEGVAVKLKDDGSPAFTKAPSPALAKIVAGHRDDVIAAARM